jgi:hypothetical protein
MNDLNFIGAPGAVIMGLLLGLAFFYGIVKFQSSTKGVSYAFSGRRLFLAFLFLFFTFPLSWPVFPASWHINVPYPVNILFLAVNVVFLMAAFRTPCLYCTDCGTYIGTKPETCPDCGCQTHTKTCELT